jgi:hypothetical protein
MKRPPLMSIPMISHTITVKEVKIVPWINQNAPKITDNATLAKYLESCPFEEGDFLCYGTLPITGPGMVSLVLSIERDFKYLTFTTYNNMPKVLHVANMGAMQYTNFTVYNRWDSCESFRKLTPGEIKSVIMPIYDNIFNSCKEHLGPEALAKLETYRAL